MSATKTHPVVLLLTLAECEALTLFIAQRQELWALHAADCGVREPEQLPVWLVSAHAEGVKRVAE